MAARAELERQRRLLRELSEKHAHMTSVFGSSAAEKQAAATNAALDVLLQRSPPLKAAIPVFADIATSPLYPMHANTSWLRNREDMEPIMPVFNAHSAGFASTVDPSPAFTPPLRKRRRNRSNTPRSHRKPHIAASNPRRNSVHNERAPKTAGNSLNLSVSTLASPQGPVSLDPTTDKYLNLLKVHDALRKRECNLLTEGVAGGDFQNGVTSACRP